MSCLVSVIIPAYNSAATLPKAVSSALRQDLADLEVIIVNDGSRDGTGEIAARLAATDSRVRVITIARNRGKPHAVNTAVARATGRWIAILDADDWYAPNRLSTMVAIGERECVDLVADNQFLFDDGAGCVVRTAFAAVEGDQPLDKAAFSAGSDPYADFDFGMLKPVVRTDFVRARRLRYREAARLSEDFLYLVEFYAAGGRARLVNQPLYYWRQAFGSISRQWTETGSGRWRYNFASAAEATSEVLKSLRRADEPELVALLELRMRAFRRLHVMQEINRLRADASAPTRLLQEIIVHPMVWPLLFRRIARRFWQRMAERRQRGIWIGSPHRS